MDTKSLMVALRPEIDAALAEIAKKHNLSQLKLGSGTYSKEGNFQWKLMGLCAGGLDRDAARYKEVIELVGLPPLGHKFSIAGRSYVTTGINTTLTKVFITRDDGQKQIAKTDVIKRACGIKVEA